MLNTENIIDGILRHVERFNPYDRQVLGKNLKSKIIYGENGFGDLKKVKESKHNNTNKIIKKVEPGKFSYSFIQAIISDKTNDYIPGNANVSNVIASNKPIKEFIGKDFITDISPEKVYIIFPDITFIFSTEILYKSSWKEIRTLLEEKNIIEKDIEALSESLVSIDKLRTKIENDEMTDNELKDLRRKLYGLAHIINEHIT